SNLPIMKLNNEWNIFNTATQSFRRILINKILSKLKMLKIKYIYNIINLMCTNNCTVRVLKNHFPTATRPRQTLNCLLLASQQSERKIIPQNDKLTYSVYMQILTGTPSVSSDCPCKLCTLSLIRLRVCTARGTHVDSRILIRFPQYPGQRCTFGKRCTNAAHLHHNLSSECCTTVRAGRSNRTRQFLCIPLPRTLEDCSRPGICVRFPIRRIRIRGSTYVPIFRNSTLRKFGWSKDKPIRSCHRSTSFWSLQNSMACSMSCS
ncbi:hypothetical protein AGLY_001946, partial [Aphis glycines]